MNNPIGLLEIPKLETERLILRKITSDDAADIFEYAHLPEVSEFLPWYSHQTIQDSLSFIKFAKEKFEKDSWIIFGIEIKNEKKLIGSIDVRDWKGENNCADIGYVLSKKYWNKGILTEVLRSVIRFCFEELQLNRVEAHCEEENIGSWRVMEKCGMKFEGLLRQKVFVKERYRSMKMYSILKSEYQNDKS
ncbi:MAG: GNAT family N-acetyltransferase [Ignavibacteriae bacterium HGW-Ignavibacteriae-3]|nr:MAG: GNAT family N-acetyltransferase [Ignavibacteriae bacterium HGW-Ignavibacteriae-3]